MIVSLARSIRADRLGASRQANGVRGPTRQSQSQACNFTLLLLLASCGAGDVLAPVIPAPASCDAGYEEDGGNCVDVDACAASPCFPGVACTDLPPPELGFTCGACPPGTRGDGV